jgi:hypothetical protein
MVKTPPMNSKAFPSLSLRCGMSLKVAGLVAAIAAWSTNSGSPKSKKGGVVADAPLMAIDFWD